MMVFMKKLEHCVERICIVDKPVDYPFLPDSLFSYIAKCMPRLQVSHFFSARETVKQY